MSGFLFLALALIWFRLGSILGELKRSTPTDAEMNGRP